MELKLPSVKVLELKLALMLGWPLAMVLWLPKGWDLRIGEQESGHQRHRAGMYNRCYNLRR
jgi:hypothetical protein